MMILNQTSIESVFDKGKLKDMELTTSQMTNLLVAASKTLVAFSEVAKADHGFAITFDGTSAAQIIGVKKELKNED